MLDTCLITGKLRDPSGTLLTNARVTFTLTSREKDGDILILPRPVVAQTDEAGNISVEMWPNSLGNAGTAYIVQAATDGGYVQHPAWTAVVPDAETADITDISELVPPSSVNDALAAVVEAREEANRAEAFADQTAADRIQTGLDRAAAANSEANALTYAGQADISRQQALAARDDIAAGSVRFARSNLDALRADTLFSLTPGEGKVLVQNGDIITTLDGGLRFEVVATREHWQTAGGIKLRRILEITRENALYGVPGPLLDLETFVTSIRPVGYWGGYFWGADSSNRLNRSSDFGATWTLVSSSADRTILQIFPTVDGEMLIHNSAGVSKSSGWTADPSTATWATVLSRPVGNTADFLKWGVDGDGQKFIATHYQAGGGFAQSRYVWISTDAGDTWDIVWDTVAEFPDHHQNSHIHAACYDPWDDRFYFTEGHAEPVGIRYSDDDGATWTRMDNDLGMSPAFTTMKATDFGIVCGTDGPPNGVFVIRRQTDPDQLGVEFYGNWNDLTSREGVIGFADHSWRDPDTGIVYLGFVSNFPADVPTVVYACGSSGAYPIFKEINSDRAFSVFAGGGGILVQRGTGTTWMRARTQVFGAPPVIDRGNLGTRDGEFTRPGSLRVGRGSSALGLESVAVGLNAQAGISTSNQRSIAVGAAAKANGDRVTTVGFQADAGVRSVAVGANALGSGVFAVALGNDAQATSTGGVAVGQNARAAGGIAIGINANVSGGGDSAMAIGRNSVCSSVSVAIGNSASATGAFGMAIGHSATMTTTGAHAIGHSAAASGVESLAVGYGAGATTTHASAFGRAASATHLRSVALGHASATARADCVMIGDRDLESTRNGGRIILRQPNGTLRAISVDNSGAIIVGAV